MFVSTLRRFKTFGSWPSHSAVEASSRFARASASDSSGAAPNAIIRSLAVVIANPASKRSAAGGDQQMEATGVGEYVGFFMRLGGAKLRVLEHFGFPKCHALWPHRPRCRTSEAPDGRGPVRTSLAELISQASAIWKKKPISVPTYGPVWACHWRRRRETDPKSCFLSFSMT